MGASGAGKTTVVELLQRFIDPEAGRVTLNGRDLREYRQEDVRSAIAVVGQEAHLFSASLRDNVALARPDASDAAVEHALRRARLWDWVRELPDGLDTQVGEAGRGLSGGQRQRVALARALLADAPVLVLDEPTAHLDPPTAEGLMRDLLTAAAGRSILLITHRPEGLELVDEVVDLAVTRRGDDTLDDQVGAHAGEQPGDDHVLVAAHPFVHLRDPAVRGRRVPPGDHERRDRQLNQIAL